MAELGFEPGSLDIDSVLLTKIQPYREIGPIQYVRYEPLGIP